MDKKITYKPFGNKAILIEWQPLISEDILNEILTFKSKIEQNSKIDFSDLIVGYNSLTIKYKRVYKTFSDEVLLLKNIHQTTLKVEKTIRYLWTIPVCYDLEFGIDLEEISNKTGLSVSKIIQLHTKKSYTIFFIGFLPGFLYLGDLDEQIYFDRKPTPRLQIDKGSVAIGGKQTGVYPMNSPGGWNIIGKTPIHFFDIKKTKPCFAKAGDKIKFESVSVDDYHQIKKEISENEFQLYKTSVND